MLESSSHSAPNSQPILMACSIIRLAYCSTVLAASCWQPTVTTIEFRCSRVTMARSCPSLAGRATNQASSSDPVTLRSLTILIVSSSSTQRTIAYKHGRGRMSNRSCRASAGMARGVSSSRFTIDRHHRRLIVVDTLNQRLVFLSLTDLSFLFSIGDKRGSQPRMFYNPSGAAVDHDRDRIVVTDACNHRLQVLSSIDGSFLFEFGEEGDQPGQLSFPHGVCIVADSENHRLQAFTHEGHHISSFTCDDDERDMHHHRSSKPSRR